MTPDRLRQIANLLFALGQLLLPLLIFTRGFDASTAQGPSAAAPNPASPAGYAFAVWGVIYLGGLAYAVLQSLPGAGADPLFRRIGWLTAAGFALCCAWLYFARFGPVLLTVPIIFGMLITLGPALMIALQPSTSIGWTREAFVRVPLAIYVGWLTAATFVNAADVLPDYGFDRFGLSPLIFGLGVIGAAAVLAISVVLFRPHPAYVATVLWALVAIAVAAGRPGLGNPVSLAACGAAALLLGVAAIRLLPRATSGNGFASG
ncbi:hypothetical protein BZG35_16580 [Brevundimonas sp. LM2]|uniref:hypothetical protein n=1 Tax=Brevundimonas sp. LM2 TaxID=1938605 RepID=UPI000983A93C|nr:hypothetical protein [Brevundimonas sp. LM2]AQR63089.1 hypothetical protein BZG35_16580 [Brevundimonas sp. LM2]